MSRVPVLVAVILLAWLAVPAQASLISPIDPVIGVREIASGSPDVTDGSPFALEECDEESGLSGYFCAPYDNNLEVELHALDLSFWDEDGLPIPTVTEEGQNFFAAEESDFQGLLNVGLFTVRLCDTETSEGVSACAPIVIDGPIPIFLFSTIPVGSSLYVFSDVPGFVSIRAVNVTTLTDNQPPLGQPLQVPEPATLVLLGVGFAAAAGRRLRRHSRG